MTRQEKPRMKMVYIAHPFNGLQENVADAQNVILKLLKKYPDTTFYSTVLLLRKTTIKFEIEGENKCHSTEK